MLEISEADVGQRIERDNPWWGNSSFAAREATFPRRIYFAPFKHLATNPGVQRAAVLLGPRRVGKTVILRQLIHELIASGFDPKSILYASVDAPIYSRFSLERFLDFLPNTVGNSTVVFDEIQYLQNWEVHLKDLVDRYPGTKFVVSGSAAAALKLKSAESGAGRFSDFMLPPLTFYEFLLFTGDHDNLVLQENEKNEYKLLNVDELNSRFIDYLNYGGYPEAVLNKEIRDNADQFIKSDIIDKVLLKDLPSLYGIQSIPELNRLFSFLAYNAGNEASLDGIAKTSGISKPTITRYIEYLESAFLIMKLSTVDDKCRTLKRERNFKVYLNNPSMRAALFSPVKADESDKIGHLAECAVFSQWQHSPGFRQLRYARWKDGGEVDVVYLSSDEKPLWAGEIKWSDRISDHYSDQVKSMTNLLERHDTIKSSFFTTKTISNDATIAGRTLRILPSAFYCYIVGRNAAARLDQMISDVPRAVKVS